MAKLHLITRTAATMETAFDDFIRFSRAKNLSEETIINYQRQFKHLIIYLKETCSI